MFDKELFYSICEKYQVELSDEYGKVMLKTDDSVRELVEDDVKNIIPRFQTYFFYSNFKALHKQKVIDIYMPDELLIAC